MTKPLFAWDELEDSPEVSTIRRTLGLVPDGKLLKGVRAQAAALRKLSRQGRHLRCSTPLISSPFNRIIAIWR